MDWKLFHVNRKWRAAPGPSHKLRKGSRSLAGHANARAPRGEDTSRRVARLSCLPRPLPTECLGVPAALAGWRPRSFRLRLRPGGGLSTGPERSRGLSLLSPPLPEKKSEPGAERRRFPLQRVRFIAKYSRPFRERHSPSVLPLGRNGSWRQVRPPSSRHGFQTQASQPAPEP